MSDELSGMELPPGGICKLCRRPFQKKPHALHQEFCSPEHRIEWHNEQRKAALKLLRQSNKGATPA